eukprot:Gb_27422 [translate_table: standard]
MFSYTIQDQKNHTDKGTAKISVLSFPPYFSSLPGKLYATEDIPTPKSGSFSGFEVDYSNLQENITVKLNAEHGHMYLSPAIVQLWQPLEFSNSAFSFTFENGSRKREDLVLTGPVGIINCALRSLQYFG